MGNRISRRRYEQVPIREFEPTHQKGKYTATDSLEPVPATAANLKDSLKTYAPDQQRLLINVNSFQNLNIFAIAPREYISGLMCISVPAGTWIYKTISKQREKGSFNFGNSEWFSNLSVAAAHRDSDRPIIMAMQALHDLHLIDLNHRGNVEKILTCLEELQRDEEDDYTRAALASGIDAVRSFTGVNASTWNQLKMAFSAQPLGTFMNFRIGSYLLGNRRLSTLDGERIMMNQGLCPFLYKTHDITEETIGPEGYVPIAGYISASVPSAFNGTLSEELFICKDISWKLSRPYILDQTEVQTLLETGQLLPSKYIFKLRERVRHRDLLFIIAPLVAAYLYYRNYEARKSHRALFDQEVANFKAGCADPSKKTRPEIIRALFSASSYNLRAMNVFNVDTGEEFGPKDLCTVSIAFPFTPSRIMQTAYILSNLAMPSIFTLMLTKRLLVPHEQKIAQIKALQERMARDEVLPSLDELSREEIGIVTDFLQGSVAWKQGVFPELKSFRKMAVQRNPGLPALGFVRPNGDSRTSTEEVLRACLLYALRDKKSIYTALGTVSYPLIGSNPEGRVKSDSMTEKGAKVPIEVDDGDEEEDGVDDGDEEE